MSKQQKEVKLKEVKLKASVADFVGPLLKRLKLAKEQVPDKDSEDIIDQISTCVEETKDIIESSENWDKTLTGYFGEIERQIDYWIDNKDKTAEWNKTVRTELINVCIKLSTKLIENHPKAGTNSHEGAFELHQEQEQEQRLIITNVEVGESSNRDYQEQEQEQRLIITNVEVGESSNRDYQEQEQEQRLIITNVEVGESSNRDYQEQEQEQEQRLIITNVEVGESSNRDYQEQEQEQRLIITNVAEFVESLGFEEQRCLYSLCIFPANTELKKRLLIHWWFVLGLVDNTSTTAERAGQFFSYLVHKGILIPVHIREHNKVIDRCTIEPTIHMQLISICEMVGCIKSENGEEGTWHLHRDGEFNLKGLLNLDQRYLNSKDISSNHDLWGDLQVIQFGSWRYTKPEAHIEVDETEFLKKLGAKVTYLSLRGISGIEELHESIGKLENLIILDLKACHNLEKLPQKPRSTFKPKLIRRALPKESRWFEKLMVLDISECYLIDHMPKWVCELSNLEVLKGFVVSRMGSKNQYCQLSDLTKLNKLRKLSIRIASEHLVKENFSGLKDLDRLLVLTIIWSLGHSNKSNDTIDSKLISSSGHGNKSNDTIDNKPISSSGQSNKSNDTIPTYYFPKNLEKLDIRCYPEAEASELLNPAELKNLRKLYIRGGRLTNIPYSDKWEVEILRLRFLKYLKTNWVELENSFNNLKYVQYVECPEIKNFPEGTSHWIMEMKEPPQSRNSSET